MESCGHTSVASLATGRSAFFGNKFPVPVPNRRQAVHFRQRCNTRAILEKAREVISPSNGASASAKPSTDPSAVQADVLQNLGKQSSPECCACHKSDESHRFFVADHYVGFPCLRYECSCFCTEYVVGAPSSKIPNGLDASSVYRGVAASVREHLIDAFNRTQDYWRYCVNKLRYRETRARSDIAGSLFLHWMTPALGL